jgi:hypothetical protein
MNVLDVLITVCLPALLVLIAIGIQSLQAWLEHWEYDRHFDD